MDGFLKISVGVRDYLPKSCNLNFDLTTSLNWSLNTPLCLYMNHTVKIHDSALGLSGFIGFFVGLLKGEFIVMFYGSILLSLLFLGGPVSGGRYHGFLRFSHNTFSKYNECKNPRICIELIHEDNSLHKWHQLLCIDLLFIQFNIPYLTPSLFWIFFWNNS